MKPNRSVERISSRVPLERLWRRGSRSLSDAELLCVLLRSGGSTAQGVLAGGLAGLLHWEPERLLRQPGFGRVRGGTVLALIELTRRLARVRMPQRRLMERRDLVRFQGHSGTNSESLRFDFRRVARVPAAGGYPSEGVSPGGPPQ